MKFGNAHRYSEEISDSTESEIVVDELVDERSHGLTIGCAKRRKYHLHMACTIDLVDRRFIPALWKS